MDYCSQLWMPIDAASILKLEKVRYDFIRKIQELKEMDYWTALKHMKMISVQRRMERYRAIYCWKIIEKLAPNCGVEVISETEQTRLGRRLLISNLKGNTRTNTMKDQCF